MKLYIVRHGESLSNVAKSVSDDATLLSENGKKQAKEAQQYFLTIDLKSIYSSPLARAIETAKIIASPHNHLEIQQSNLLKDKKDASSLVGVSKEKIPWDYIKQHRNDPDWRHEDAESFNDIKQRVISTLELMDKYKEEDNVLIVSHNSFIKYLVLYIILGDQFTPENFYKFSDRMETKNTGVTVLERKQKYYETVPSWYLLSWMS